MREDGQFLLGGARPALLRWFADIPRMSVIPLTIFFSLLLAGLFIVLFVHEQRRRQFASTERDSLLPLADETPHEVADGTQVPSAPAGRHSATGQTAAEELYPESVYF